MTERMVLALQDATRKRILFSFYSDPRPRTVDQVVSMAGVHRSVAYAHLERLVGLGYLATGLRRGSRGRPAKTYRLAPEPPSAEPPAHGLLTTLRMLSEAIGELGARGRAAARGSAVRLGRSLAPAGSSPGSWLEPLAELGDRLRLEPPGQVVVERCAFRDACAAEPALVPTLHAGLIEGVLERSPLRGRVTPSRCQAGGCVFSLQSHVEGGADGTAA
ncbi:MAG: hypothetical protein ACP5PW_04920 [Candidatus Dormibacteria bacterium]